MEGKLYSWKSDHLIYKQKTSVLVSFSLSKEHFFFFFVNRLNFKQPRCHAHLQLKAVLTKIFKSFSKCIKVLHSDRNRDMAIKKKTARDKEAVSSVYSLYLQLSDS